MAKYSAYISRDKLESGAGLRIFGIVESGDTLAIEMPNNSRIAATIKSITPGYLWLEIDGTDVGFNGGSDESNLMPTSPLASTDWTQI